jgi:hypothetical protein
MKMQMKVQMKVDVGTLTQILSHCRGEGLKEKV